MNWKMFWRIITTPSCWLRNHSTDRRCNELIRYLIDNKERVSVDFDRYDRPESFYYLKLRIGGQEYRFWIRNKWYCYLSGVYGDQGFSGLPSRTLCFEFYDTFEKPFREKHYIELSIPKERTFIKPEKHDAEK